MADLLPSILAFPPDRKTSLASYDKQAHEYVTHLLRLPSTTWTKQNPNKPNILDTLNPASNSLPYLIALLTQIQAIGNDRALAEDCATRSQLFLTSFDPIQVRYAGEQWRNLIEWNIEILSKLNARDFTVLTTALLRLDPTGATFTLTHLRLVRLCLQEGTPRQALPLLDKNITAFPTTLPKPLHEEPLCDPTAHEQSNTFITPKSNFSPPLRAEYILEYHLLGAGIYIALRNYSRARLFLELVLLHPAHSSAHAASALQAEAYKKFALLGLLEQGKAYPLPRTHDAQVFKALRAASRAYESLVEDFEKRDVRKLVAEIDAGGALWAEDGNPGLVNEVQAAVLRWKVLDLERTFAAFPLSRVAAHLELREDETLRLLTRMQEQGYLSDATITPASSSQTSEAVLSFLPATSTTISTSTKHDSDLDLALRTARITSLTTSLKQATHLLTLTKPNIEYAKRLRSSALASAAANGNAAGDVGEDIAEQMDLEWDAPIEGLMDDDDEEEGIMGGMGRRVGGDGDGDEDLMA